MLLDILGTAICCALIVYIVETISNLKEDS